MSNICAYPLWLFYRQHDLAQIVEQFLHFQASCGFTHEAFFITLTETFLPYELRLQAFQS
ncbi:hypothetical protein D9H31_15140 [Escherichia coli]|nr:hypothetical protein [Escherichia coli]